MPDEWVRELEDLWAAHAEVFRPSIPDVECEAADSPGYVRLSVGGTQVWAPVFLAVSFPVDGLLEIIINLGSAIRIDGTSVLCISGSAVFGRALQSISDLDYCEYLNGNEADIGSLVDTKAFCVNPAFFIRGRVDEQRFARRDVTHNGVKFAGVPVLNSVKLKYVGKTVERLLPVSNLSLVGLESLRRTWPFQEVRITPPGGRADDVPGLIDAHRLGEYLEWLAGQIAAHLTTKPAKALKRALCLARITGSALAEEALQSLNRTPIVRQCLAEGLDEVIAMATAVAADDERLLSAAQEAQAELGALKDLSEAAEDCRRVAVTIKNEFDKNVVAAADHLLPYGRL